MKTFRFKTAIIVILISAAVVGCGRRGTGNSAGSSEVSANAQLIVLSAGEGVSSDTVDMGKLGSGEIVSKPLRIKNGGTDPVVIIDIDKTCGCVDFTYPRQPIRPGDEAAMELEFDSRGIKGWVYKTAILKTSSPAGEHLIVVTADVQ